MSIFVDHAMLKHKLKVRGCKAHLSADQSVPSATWTRIALDVEDFDDSAEFDPSTHQATIKSAGRYLIIGAIQWRNMVACTDTEMMVARNGIYPPGGGIIMVFLMSNPAAASYATVIGSTVANLAAGDVIDLWAYQNTGSARTIYGSNVYINTFLVILRVG